MLFNSNYTVQSPIGNMSLGNHGPVYLSGDFEYL